MNSVKRRSIFELVAVALFATSFCLSAMAQQVDPATYQRVVEENIDLRQEQARQVKENGELRRKNADLILDVQDLEAKREQLVLLVAQLKTPEESKGELDRLRLERAALMGELERVRQSLLTVVPAPANPVPPLAQPAQPSPERGSSLFRKVEQENADLRLQLAQEREVLQSRTKAHDAVTAQVSEYRTQVETLSHDLAGAKRDIEQAKVKEAALRKALEKLARQSFQQQEELIRLKAGIATLEKEKAGKGVRSAPGVSESDGDTGGLLMAAQSALRGGRIREAEKLYDEVLKKNPKDPRVYYNLGVLHGDYLKNPEKAVYYYRKYLDMAPTARDASKVRSWILDLGVPSDR